MSFFGLKRDADAEFLKETPRTVSAPFWRVFLLRWSLRFNAAGMPKRSKLCWRLSRLWAFEKTHQALAATACALLMFGEP